MSNEDFLSRWSRRKRVAKAAPESLPSSLVSSPPSAGEDEAPVVDSEAGQSVKEPDLPALPPLDTITAATDVTAFLRKGVPSALTREALRRAWAADPAIRDFVGLAENAWDFNDPNVMPGFGPLDYTPEQVRNLVASIIKERNPVVEGEATSAAPQLQQNVINPAAPTVPSSEGETAADATTAAIDQVESDGQVTETGIATPRTGSMAADDEQARQSSLVRRTHGRALPQ